MNITLISQDFLPATGGIETYAAEIANYLASCCDQFVVIAPDKPHAADTDSILPYSVYRITSKNSFLGLNALPEAPPIFKRHSTNMIFHTQWQTLPVSVFARSQGIVTHIFVAAHGRELLFNPFSSFSTAARLYECYKRWMLSQVDLFFPVSAYTADLLQQHGVPESRIRIVLNGTDPNKFYPIDKQFSRRSIDIKANKVLLTITRLVSRKGVDTALKAFKELRESHPDSCYLIVGEGPEKDSLQALASDLGIRSSVKFVGRVPYKQLIYYYNACDVFVMPSKTILPDVEGFGIVFLEANACAKPVIGTHSGGIPSAIIENETGILVNEADAHDLAQAIDYLFSNDELAIIMGKNGRERVERETNWEESAARIIDAIHHTIST